MTTAVPDDWCIEVLACWAGRSFCRRIPPSCKTAQTWWIHAFQSCSQAAISDTGAGQLKVVSRSESMNPRSSHQVDRTFSSHLFGSMWFQESEFPFTSTPNCGHLPKKGPLSFGNSNGPPPRSVFPELAKYTLLAFAAMLGVNVLYADLDWAERHKVGRHMRLYIWHGHEIQGV